MNNETSFLLNIKIKKSYSILKYKKNYSKQNFSINMEYYFTTRKHLYDNI
jgi:hypothetical protein